MLTSKPIINTGSCTLLKMMVTMFCVFELLHNIITDPFLKMYPCNIRITYRFSIDILFDIN